MTCFTVTKENPVTEANELQPSVTERMYVQAWTLNASANQV